MILAFEFLINLIPILVLLGVLAFVVWVPVQIRRNRLRRERGET